MVFAGLKKETERKNLIAYLMESTKWTGSTLQLLIQECRNFVVLVIWAFYSLEIEVYDLLYIFFNLKYSYWFLFFIVYLCFSIGGRASSFKITIYQTIITAVIQYTLILVCSCNKFP